MIVLQTDHINNKRITNHFAKGCNGKIINIKDGVAETFLNSAEILFNEGLDRQALIYGQIALHLSPNLDTASYLLGKIFRAINNLFSCY